MNAAENLARAEPLSWSEICERYRDQWVCFVDVEHDGDQPIAWALVIAADRSLDEALNQVGWWAVDSAIAYAHTSRRA